MFRTVDFPIYRQLDQMDFGPSCLKMLNEFFGKSYDLEYLRQISFLQRDGASGSLLKALNFQKERDCFSQKSPASGLKFRIGHYCFSWNTPETCWPYLLSLEVWILSSWLLFLLLVATAILILQALPEGYIHQGGHISLSIFYKRLLINALVIVKIE